MKIASSDIRFSVQREYSQEETAKAELRQRAERRTAGAGQSTGMLHDQVKIGYRSEAKSQLQTHQSSHSVVQQAGQQQQLSQLHNSYQISRAVLEQYAQVDSIRPQPIAPAAATSLYQQLGAEQLSLQASDISAAGSMAALSISEQYHYREQESMKLLSRGLVMTEDGREINFQLDLTLDRRFELLETQRTERVTRELVDPLVINFDSAGVSLSKTSFAFDLNVDGRQEQISFVGQGSGFLVLDENANGRIDDGSEMFGARTGEGFAELAQHDLDNNLWIDESDPVFSQLQIWHTNSAGEKALMSLSEAGVGAIYLGSEQSQFRLTDELNNSLGEVKRSGIFLTEEGKVSSVQEVDLALHEQNTPNIQQQRAEEMTQRVNQLQAKADAQSQQFGPAPREASLDDLQSGPFSSGSSSSLSAAERAAEQRKLMKEKLEAIREQRLEQRQLRQQRMEERQEYRQQQGELRVEKRQQRELSLERSAENRAEREFSSSRQKGATLGSAKVPSQ